MATKGPTSAGSSCGPRASRRPRYGWARCAAWFMAVGIGAAMVLAPSSTALAASTGCGSLSTGASVYVGRVGACTVPSPAKPYTTFTDGEQVDLAIGANSVFSTSDRLAGDIEAIECAYRAASGRPGDPPSAEFCDAQTTPGDFPYSVRQGGSFDYVVDNRGDHVTIFALPDTALPTSTISCDATHACVWYVGENYNNFTAPHVFSNPFLVGPKASAGGSGSSSTIIIVVVIVVAAAIAVVVMRRRRRPAGVRTR